MAAEVLTLAKLVINSVNLSDHCTDMTLDATREQVDDTAFGDTFRSRVIGLGDGSLSITLHMDYAASSTWTTLNSAAGTSVAATAMKDSGSAISATNPEFQFNVLITDMTHIDTSVGALHTSSFTFPVVGAITVDTTP